MHETAGSLRITGKAGAGWTRLYRPVAKRVIPHGKYCAARRSQPNPHAQSRPLLQIENHPEYLNTTGIFKSTAVSTAQDLLIFDNEQDE
jgi:hypothetical protein